MTDVSYPDPRRCACGRRGIDECGYPGDCSAGRYECDACGGTGQLPELSIDDRGECSTSAMHACPICRGAGWFRVADRSATP